MAFSEGVGNSLSWAKETSWGAPSSATIYTVVRKLVNAAITTERTQIQTQEMNVDRAVLDIRLGTRKSRVTVPFELFYAGGATVAPSGQFDDFIESWMCAGWTAQGSTASATQCVVGTVGDISTFTFTSAPAAAQLTGAWVKVAGFAVTSLGNNGYFRVAIGNGSIASGVTALGLATPGYSVAGIVATTQTAVTVTPMAYVKPGSAGTGVKSLVFAEQQKDTAGTAILTKVATGAIANIFSLTITPDAIAQASFDFMGKTFAIGAGYTSAVVAAVSMGGNVMSVPNTFTAAPTVSPMTANDTLMRLMVDNVAVGVVTNLTINGTNNAEEMFPIGSLVPYGLGVGDTVVSGTMDLYMTNATFWESYQAETEVGISVRLMDPDAGTVTDQASGKGYAIDIPSVRLSGVTETKDKTKVLHNVQWTALQSTSAGTKGQATANIVVSRLSTV